MISYYIQFYSAEYYFILAISRSNRPHCASQMNVSDDEDSQTVVGDDYDSQSSNEENDTIFKPKIGSLRFAPIQAGDIVELTHVANDNQLYIRSTKHDVNYENILKRTNAMISEKRQPSFLEPIKNGDVVLVRYCGDYSRAVVLDKDERSVELVDIGVTMNSNAKEIYFMTSDISVCQDRMVTPVFLELPKMSEEENTAVFELLKKSVHNRFIVHANNAIRPNSTVNLVHITNGQSLAHLCQCKLRKICTIADIGSTKLNKSHNINLTVIDSSHLDKGVISFVRTEDFQKFVDQSMAVTEFGKSIAYTEPYKPEKSEICLALLPDDDGTIMWYRAQFQEELVNNKAQVALIDFHITAVVKMSNLRKLNDFGFERISFFGKIRSENYSLDLLDRNAFAMFNNVTSILLEPVGDSFGIHFDDSYYIEDENYEEEILDFEDL